ncbi:MAG: sulfite exporter TauE/SafE family protein [Patescibacteria group bacterium]
MNLGLIFLTGLTTGGLSCLAVQGGLLVSLIANLKSRFLFLPVGMFLLSKAVAYTILGFLLGLFGSRISFNETVSALFQLFAALFMFGTAMNLLNVHPIFRYLTITPPAFVRRWLKSTGKSEAIFTPLILGAMTILIPCGVTQAMEVLAINSANPIQGALIMLFFVLGTAPLFVLFGISAARFSEAWQVQFSRVASVLLIVFSLYVLNSSLILFNSPVNFSTLARPVKWFFSDERFSSGNTQNAQNQVTININNSGYSPKYFKVKVGEPVELTLKSNNVRSCALSFVFKAFNLRAILQPTDKQTFTFTPTKTGSYTYSCSMGMYSGIMEVVD